MKENKRAELIEGKPTGDGFKILILETVEPGESPDYPTVGKVSCGAARQCGEWLWVSPTTLPLVRTGDMIPVCRTCGLLLTSQPGAVQLGIIDSHGEAE